METISAFPQKATQLAQKQRLFKEASRLLAIEQRMHQALLHPELASHCRVASWCNGSLKILIDSPTWATRFRFQISSLLDTLKSQLPALKEIECRVIPQPGAIEVTYWPAVPISRETATMLQGTAAAVSDEKLKAALYRLAETRSLLCKNS